MDFGHLLTLAIFAFSSYYMMSSSILFRAVVVGLLTLYVIVPLIYRYCATLQRHLIFLPFVRWPRNVDFVNPETEGLPATRNFYLESEPGVSIGVWHILPKSLMNSGKYGNADFFENSLSHGESVILYLHGNSGSRAGPHRVELYVILRNLNYHVVCIDYRGYADSSRVTPSEDGVVKDGKFVYNWLRDRVHDAPLFIWGHSLGTGISSRVVSELSSEGDPPLSLILESPFSNIQDEVLNHPLSTAWRHMPFFGWFFLDPLIFNNLEFASDRHIANINIPILILHAEDDAIIPVALGRKLYQAARTKRSSSAKPAQFFSFDGKHGYGHKYICRAPELPDIIRKFINSSIADDWQ